MNTSGLCLPGEAAVEASLRVSGAAAGAADGKNRDVRSNEPQPSRSSQGLEQLRGTRSRGEVEQRE